MLTHFQIFDFLFSAVLTQNFLVSANKCGKQPSILYRWRNQVASQVLYCLGLRIVIPLKINIELVILMKYNAVYALLNFCFCIQLYSTSSIEPITCCVKTHTKC